MKQYRVLRSEVHYSHVIVEAETPEEAVELVEEGEGGELRLEYGYTIDGDSMVPWDVFEEKP